MYLVEPHTPWGTSTHHSTDTSACNFLHHLGTTSISCQVKMNTFLQGRWNLPFVQGCKLNFCEDFFWCNFVMCIDLYFCLWWFECCTSTLGEGWWYMFHFSWFELNETSTSGSQDELMITRKFFFGAAQITSWAQISSTMYFKICKILWYPMDFTCPGLVKANFSCQTLQLLLDWSRTWKRFYFHVELPHDQDMGTSLIHTSTFENPINSLLVWSNFVMALHYFKGACQITRMLPVYVSLWLHLYTSYLLWLKWEKNCTWGKGCFVWVYFLGWVLLGLQLLVGTAELPNFRSCCCCRWWWWCCCWRW